MTKRSRSKSFSQNLSIRDIYVGEIDTTMEIRVGGPSALRNFYNTYYVRNERELDDFKFGRKQFVYGQKGAGKTAFLRYFGESIERDKELSGKTILYFFSEDFPDQAHRDITEYVKRKRKSEFGVSLEEKINIFRDLDYEDFWTYLILERLATFLDEDGSYMVEKNQDLISFQTKIRKVEKGSIMDRILRLVPSPKSASLNLSKEPSADFTFEWGEKNEEFDKFSKYVADLRQSFSKLNWIGGYVNLMFDEIDPRPGTGEDFDLDCILIRDLIVTIYRLNTLDIKCQKRCFFSAAIRSEVLHSVERLGKEVHKKLSQLGIHMSWGEYGTLDKNHPLIHMICRKIQYSEQLKGGSNRDIDEVVSTYWDRYFRKDGKEALAPKEFLRDTWLRPRDTVRLMKICKELDGNQKFFSRGSLERTKIVYSNESWQEIVSQLSANMSPNSISALNTILPLLPKEFYVSGLQNAILSQSSVFETVASLKNEISVGNLLNLLYLNGVIVNKDGGFFRSYFRGDFAYRLDKPFIIHPGLRKRFGAMKYEENENDEFPIKGGEQFNLFQN